MAVTDHPGTNALRVPERIDAEGGVVLPLDEAALIRAAGGRGLRGISAGLYRALFQALCRGAVRDGEDMWHTVCRTAFSLFIAESRDFACELLDKDGETLAHSPWAMPVFNLTLPQAVKALLARYPAETLQPGGVLITNDPWLCAGHLFNIAIVTPCFRDGQLVGLMGIR